VSLFSSSAATTATPSWPRTAASCSRAARAWTVPH